MNTNDIISYRIKALILEGVEPISALRVVCGDKAVDSMIEDVYTRLRAVGGKVVR